jgi:hypothetical protein
LDRPERDGRPRSAGRRPLALCAALLAVGALAWWVAREQEAPDAWSAGAVASTPNGTSEAQRPALPPVSPREHEVGELNATSAKDPTASPRAAGEAVAGALVGQVVRPDGSPVPDADVIVAAHERQLQGEILALREARRIEVRVPESRVLGRDQAVAVGGKADPAGRFRIELDAAQLAALANPLVAVISGLTDVAVSRGGPVSAGNNDLGDLVLPVGARLRLRLVEPDGDAVWGGRASVEMTSHDAPEGSNNDGGLLALRGWLTGGRSADDGVVELDGLPSGEGLIEIEVEHWQEMRLGGVALTAGTLTDLGDVVLDAGRSIEGVVLDPEAKPVPGVQVSVNAEHGPSRLRRDQVEISGRAHNWAAADVQGRFRASGLGEGTYTVELSVPAYTTARVTGVAAGSRDVQLQLQRLATIVVTLLDARTGTALDGATFTGTIPADGDAAPASPLQLEVTSGASAGLAAGLYRVAGVSERGTRLSVQAEGYPTHTVDVPGLAPESTLAVTIRLDPGFVLAGQVVDFENRPIVGADVQAALREGIGFRGETRLAQTDTDGHFRFAGVASGQWTCWVSAPGVLAAQSAELEIIQGDVDDVLFRLAPESTIEGRVFAHSGDPLPGAVVVPELIEALPAPRSAARSAMVLVESSLKKRAHSGSASDDGAYRLVGLAPGDYLLSASTVAEDLLGKRLRSLATAARDPACDLPAEVVRITLGLGEHRKLDLVVPRPATLTGAIRSGNMPAMQAKVDIWLRQDHDWASVAQVACDADGRYAIDGLPAGEVVVVAVAGGEPQARARLLTLSEGQAARADLDFEGQSVNGMTIDAVTKRPIAGVTLRIGQWTITPAGESADLPPAAFEVLRQGLLRLEPIVSDASGRFVLSHLLPGDYALQVDSREWFQKNQPRFTVDGLWSGDDVVMEVSAGAVLEGTLRYALGGVAGIGPEDLEVGLYLPEEVNTVAAWVYVRDGAYRLQGLQAGSYEVRVRDMRAGGIYVHQQPVTLAADEHRVLDITLEK